MSETSLPKRGGASASGRSTAEIAARVGEALDALLGTPAHRAGPLVVATSGGLDSMVLAHLLRFGVRPRPTVVLAHFDHAMRAGSAVDALWLRGVARAWALELRSARSAEAPASEEEARRARYAFLAQVRADVGARAILTAHHADDQAETVLFRILRGTGIDGLRGIDARRERGPGLEGGAVPGLVLRPMLDLWREELEAYAGAVGLRWREDPTNREGSYARNVIRREILPLAEAAVAPGARRALVRLAAVARDDDAAWTELLPDLLARLEWDGEGIDAGGIAALGPALRGRVLRELARHSGLVLDHGTTERAVAFAGRAASGHGIPLGRGVELRRELDRLVIVTASDRGEDAPLEIPGPGPGSGTARLGGRSVRVRWGPRGGADGAGAGRDPDPASSGESGPRESGPLELVLPLREIRFPLLVRGRCPGDRIEVWGGTRRVKRLLQDARVPSRERPGVPLVVDAEGRVLWIPGVAEWRGAEAGGGGPGDAGSGARPGDAEAGARPDAGDRRGPETISITVEEG